VIFARDAYEKIMYWVRKCPLEISGLGKCIYKDGAFHVTEAYLLEQVNTAATTDLDATAVSKLQFESRDEPGHLNFWWHSHVNMNVFWSGTDTDTIKQYGDQGFCLATVFNKKNETKSAFYQGDNGFLPPVFLNDLEMEIDQPVLDEAKVKIWDSEYELKAKTRRSLSKVHKGNNTREWTAFEKNQYYPKYDQLLQATTYWDATPIIGVPRYVLEGTHSILGKPRPSSKRGRRKAKKALEQDTIPTGTATTKVGKGTSTDSKTNGTKGTAVVQSKKAAPVSIGLSVCTNLDYNVFYDVLAVSSATRATGVIHPTIGMLRWDRSFGKNGNWINYRQFMAKYPQYTEDNMLDYLGAREEEFDTYLKVKGRPPVDDWDLDKSFMDRQTMTEALFYNPSKYMKNKYQVTV